MKFNAKQKRALKNAVWFFVLTLIFSALFSYLGMRAALSQPVLVLLYSFGVVIAVLAMKGMSDVPLGNFKNVLHLYFLALILPLTYVAALFLFTQDLAIFSLDVMYLLAPASLFVLISSFFEEVGWRGFLFSTLKPFGWIWRNLIIGLFWALWHFPAIFAGSYDVGDSLLIGLALFVINVVLLSFVIAWFRAKTNGIVAGTLLHTTHNLSYLWIGGAFSLSENDLLKVGESGWLLSMVLLLVILLFAAWKEPKKA